MSNDDMYFLLIKIITQNNVENKHNILFSQHNEKKQFKISKAKFKI
jgi:hypothetical protein